MQKIESHRDLIVRQKAMDLAVLVYAAAARFPASENYGMKSQLTRSIVSVAANIAEGHARSTARDFANFLHIAAALSLNRRHTSCSRCDSDI